MTDDWDRRCLQAMLQRFYHPDVLESEDFCYSPDGVASRKKLRLYYLHWIYFLQVYLPILDCAALPDVRRYIESLPAHDESELFGIYMSTRSYN